MTISFSDIWSNRFPAFEPGAVGGSDISIDLDMDGDYDLITPQLVFPPNEDIARPLRIYENLGDDTFVQGEDTFFPGGVPDVKSPLFEFRDFTGDTRPDLLIVDFGYDDMEQEGARNQLFKGRADGSFVEVANAFPDFTTASYGYAVSDIDRDGDLDLLDLSIGRASVTNQLFLNDGKGRFTPANDRLPTAVSELFDGDTIPAWYGASFVDVDGINGPDMILAPDGFLMLVTDEGRLQDTDTTFDIDTPIVFYNDGTGRFSNADRDTLPATPLQRAQGDFGYEKVATGDLDGDGRDEIVYISQSLGGSGPVSWAIQIVKIRADGSFRDVTDAWAGEAITTGPGGTDYVWLRDFDFDGDLDIVTRRAGDPLTNAQPVIYLNEGNGRFRDMIYNFDDSVIGAIGRDATGQNPLAFASFVDFGTHDISVRRADAPTFTEIRREGGRESDVLEGAAGTDILLGRGGNDTLLGIQGDDRLYGHQGADYLDGMTGDDLLKGDQGGDRLLGGSGSDRLFGGAGSDTLSGGIGGDRLNGGAGGDRLLGDGGADRLIGKAGSDTLIGGNGNDRIDGGNGNDQLRGGKGADQFVFRPGDGADEIADFSGRDVLNLKAYGLESASEALDALSVTQAGVLLSLGDDTILLTGLQISDFSARDFLI